MNLTQNQNGDVLNKLVKWKLKTFISLHSILNLVDKLYLKLVFPILESYHRELMDK